MQVSESCKLGSSLSGWWSRALLIPYSFEYKMRLFFPSKKFRIHTNGVPIQCFKNPPFYSTFSYIGSCCYETKASCRLALLRYFWTTQENRTKNSQNTYYIHYANNIQVQPLDSQARITIFQRNMEIWIFAWK